MRITAALEQAHGSCLPITVSGTDSACLGVDANSIVSTTERTLAAATAIANYLEPAGPARHRRGRAGVGSSPGPSRSRSVRRPAACADRRAITGTDG